MTGRRLFFACAALLLASGVSPATAGEPWLDGPWHHGYWHHGHGPHWRAIHGAIYESDNRIAFLEADPEIDDGYKGPIITGARADIVRLRATLHPAHWRWASPCCYSRRPIHIR
jgi:hypothetical protein